MVQYHNIISDQTGWLKRTVDSLEPAVPSTKRGEQNKMEFSKAKMKEVIKNQTDKRVSEDSATTLGEILEMYAGDIAEEAIAIANDDGRKTVRAEDIREALK